MSVCQGDDPNDSLPDMSDIARFQEEDEEGDGFEMPTEGREYPWYKLVACQLHVSHSQLPAGGRHCIF